MESSGVSIPEDAAGTLSLAVVQELAPVETPILLGHLEALIEMAEEGELVYIDPRDPGGGFGATDPLCVTIVPVVVEALRWVREGIDIRTVNVRLEGEIERVARKIGSKHAQESQAALKEAIYRNLQSVLQPQGGPV